MRARAHTHTHAHTHTRNTHTRAHALSTSLLHASCMMPCTCASLLHDMYIFLSLSCLVHDTPACKLAHSEFTSMQPVHIYTRRVHACTPASLGWRKAQSTQACSLYIYSECTCTNLHLTETKSRMYAHSAWQSVHACTPAYML
jgi:hypothetical protein